MITRDILSELELLFTEYPVVTVLGPRQAGKTTLVRKLLTGFDYSNLELPETRELARFDPKAYLSQFKSKVIIDEIQRVPSLLSYIQTIVDEKNINGQFILTGSHQLQLHEAVTQSLAGRTAVLNLLPFSINELSHANIDFDSWEQYCFSGFLPRIHDQHQRPTTAYSNYYRTYVERDVRQLINLKDINIFEKFMKLMAGRVGQILNQTSLANDVGMDVKTIQHWISILEASFLIFKLSPYYENFGKRVIKSPKYYFTDVGLLSFLLNIEKPEQITRDPLVGSLFENLVVVELLKERTNKGKLPNLYFYRDSNGNEVDILLEDGSDLIAIEIKSSSTFSSSLLKNLKRFKSIAPQVNRCYLVYNGEAYALTDKIDTLSYKNIASIMK